MPTLYETKPWREHRARVLARDSECYLAGVAGECRGALHVHHVDPLSEGGPAFPDDVGLVVLCARHHTPVHDWRQRKEKTWKRCPHHHRTHEARQQCEARLNKAA